MNLLLDRCFNSTHHLIFMHFATSTKSLYTVVHTGWNQFEVGGGGWVGCQNWKYSKCQEVAKFQFFQFSGGVVECQNWKYSKCQEMTKFQFFWGGVFRSKLWSSQIWSFSWGGGAFWSEIPERGFLENLDKYQGVKEFYMLARIGSL